MTGKIRPMWLLGLVAILLAAGLLYYQFGRSASAQAGPSWARLEAAADDPGDWVTYGGTFDEQRFSRLTKISDANVGQLGLAWSYEFDTNRAQETTPLEYDGVLYATSAWSKVFAFDAKSGNLLWSYDPEVPGDAGGDGCCDVGNRGAAIYDGKLYFGTFDGRLIALDIKTGKPVWSVLTVDRSKPYTITGAPRVVKGKVVIGNGGAELGVRGYVTAYDAETGKQAWRFYTVPGNPADAPDNAASDDVLASKAAPSWSGKFWEAGGGGTVWDSIVYDQELDQLYIGVGNGSPWNHKIRSEGKGDNLFLSSIVALDPDTGKYLWHYQGTPAESWDYTHTQSIILATLDIEGKARKVLMQAPKNGFFFVIDRTDGKLLSAENYVAVNWATGYDMKTGRPIENPQARYDKEGSEVVIPGALGGHNWQPMAFSPKTGLAYIPAQDALFGYDNPADYKYRPGRWNTGIGSIGAAAPDDPAEFQKIRNMLKGSLIAWDPVKQKAAWTFDYDAPWNGGVLSTAGNLVFQGDTKGNFRAFSADTGKVLWTTNVGMPIMAAPVTFEVNGDQYVAIAAGYGGAYALTGAFNDDPGPRPNGRLLVFKLGGTAVMPEVAKLAFGPPNPSTETFAAGQVERGKARFQMDCWMCHGPGAVSSGVAPDLRRSGAVTDSEMWQQIVMGGALKDRGMMSFAKFMTPQDAEDIRAYVSERAAELKRTQKGTAK